MEKNEQQPGTRGTRIAPIVHDVIVGIVQDLNTLRSENQATSAAVSLLEQRLHYLHELRQYIDKCGDAFDAPERVIQYIGERLEENTTLLEDLDSMVGLTQDMREKAGATLLALKLDLINVVERYNTTVPRF